MSVDATNEVAQAVLNSIRVGRDLHFSCVLAAHRPEGSRTAVDVLVFLLSKRQAQDLTKARAFAKRAGFSPRPGIGAGVLCLDEQEQTLVVRFAELQGAALKALAGRPRFKKLVYAALGGSNKLSSKNKLRIQFSEPSPSPKELAGALDGLVSAKGQLTGALGALTTAVAAHPRLGERVAWRVHLHLDAELARVWDAVRAHDTDAIASAAEGLAAWLSSDRGQLIERGLSDLGLPALSDVLMGPIEQVLTAVEAYRRPAK